MAAYGSGVELGTSHVTGVAELALRQGAVTLRPWLSTDADAIVARIGDPAIVEFLDRIPQPYERGDALDYIRGSREGWQAWTHTNFAILVDGIEGAVGSVGIQWTEIAEGVGEIGYWVAAEARGRGVGTTATRLVAEWAFDVEQRLERLQLRADVRNAASNRVAEKAGFTREGVLRSSRRNVRLGRRVDFVMWSLLRAELDGG
jgi:RimJ/RimL family protein N-acetyltransferase